MGAGWKLYDYLDSRGRNVIHRWADDLGLEGRLRGKLDQKVDMLQVAGPDLSPLLLQPTRQKHVKELTVNGRRLALRPMLSLGPFDMRVEFTFLFGAIEKDNQYIPNNAPERAERNRKNLLDNLGSRCEHEQFGGQD